MPHNPLAYARGYKAGLNGRPRPEAIQPAEQRRLTTATARACWRRSPKSRPPAGRRNLDIPSHAAAAAGNRAGSPAAAEPGGPSWTWRSRPAATRSVIDKMYEAWKRRHGKE